jgi:hypothetical protein
MTNGSRAGFTSAAVFTGLGYSFSNVIPGDTSFMNTLAPINSSAISHLPGTLVNQSGTVYLMSSTGKMGIPSLAVFQSWGYSWNNVVPANSYDAAVSMSNGVMPAWTMGMLSPLGSSAGTNPTNPTNPTLPVSGGLSVSLASNTPASAYIAAGSAFNNMANINFTAGSSSVVVTQLTVTRTGLGSDSDLNNVYLFSGSTRIGYSSSLGSGRATFVNSNGLFTIPANGTATISIKADLSSGVTTSKTYSFGIAAATDVVTSGNGAVSGAFPVVGNAMTSTVLSNPALATLQVQATPVGSTVNAGTKGVLVGQFQFQAQNSNVKMSYLTLTEVGSINASSDLGNIMLKDGSGTQIGSTLSQLGANNTANFDLSANPYTISSGQNVTFSVYADVLGTPNRYFVFSIQRNSDIQAWDQTYNAGILATVQNAGSFPVQQVTNISVQAGNLVVTTDSNSPTGNIATNVSNQTLAQFDFTASGEPVKINYLPFSIVYTGNCGGTILDCNNSVLANLKLVDDQGIQLGSTFNTPSSSYNYVTTNNGTQGTGFTGSFGTSSSNLNYTIQANTTRVISIKADILATSGTITAVQANLLSATSNAQGQTSLSNVSTTANTGRSLSMNGTPFSQSTNGSLGAQSFVKGSSNDRVASFILTAGAGEGINMTSVTLATPNVNSGYYPFQNMEVFVNGTKFGSYTAGFVTGNNSYTFSGNPVAIAAGGTAVVDVYEGVQSGAIVDGTHWVNTSPAVNLTNAVGSGATSGTSRTSTGTATGQALVINTTGGSLTVSNDSGTVASSNVAMGATGVTMGSFKLTTGTTEGANLTSLTLTDTYSGTNAVNAISNIKLFDGQTQIGNTASSLTFVDATHGTATFTFGTAYNIPVSTIKTITVVADIAAYNSNAPTSGTSHIFGVAAGTNVVATGSGDGLGITPSGSAVGYAQTVFRTNLTVTLDSSSPTGVRNVSSADQIEIFDFKAASNYDVTLNSITFQLAAPVNGNLFKLRDANGVIGTCDSTFTGAACTSGDHLGNVSGGGSASAASAVTFYLPAGYSVSLGTTRALTLQVDSTNTGAWVANVWTPTATPAPWTHTGSNSYNTVQASVSAVSWGDGTGSSANLPANVLPVTGNTLQY